MVPTKLEKSIQEKLEERTIQPSANAWANLSKDLDSNDSKRNRGLIFYMCTAASVIGVLLFTVGLFNSTENQMGKPNLVDTENAVNAPQLNTDDVDHNEKVQMEVVVEVSEEYRQGNSSEHKLEVTQPVLEKDTKFVSASNQIETNLPGNQSLNAVRNGTNDKNDITKLVSTISSTSNSKSSISKTLTLEDSKAIEVVNQIKKMKIENGTVSDAEIENLLKQAHKDILRVQLYNKVTRTVDANALLQDVEDDLEQSFRNKVFDGLKSGFKTIKTAVAERNN